MDSFSLLILWVKVQNTAVYFVIQTVPALVVLSGWFLCPFDLTPFFYFLSTSILSGPTRCSRLILNFLASAQNQPFLQRTLVLLLAMVLRNQDLGAQCACCYQGITASRASQQTAQENKCMYSTHVYTAV